MKVLGLDLSLTSTGVALPDGTTRTITTNSDDALEVRLAHIMDTLLPLVTGDDLTPDLVVVEDLPRNARGAGSTGPVHGVVGWTLYLAHIPIVRPTAATIKKFATDNGNCSKDAMAVAAMKRAGLDFSGRLDECDAWWMRAAALAAYGTPVVDVPKAQRAALAKVAWPAVSADVVGAA